MILRVSDLSSVLNRGTTSTGEVNSWRTIEEAVSAFHDAAVDNATLAEKKALSSMLLEVSYPTSESTWVSKNIPYAFLSGDIQYDVLHSKAPFYEPKTFLSGFVVSGGDISCNVNNFNVSASNDIGLSGNVVNVHGNKVNLHYNQDSKLIIWCDKNDGSSVSVATFAFAYISADESSTPTVKFGTTSTSNPIDGTAKHALWS